MEAREGDLERGVQQAHVRSEGVVDELPGHREQLILKTRTQVLAVLY